MAKAKKAKTKKAATTKAAKPKKKATAEERIDNLAAMLEKYRKQNEALSRRVNKQARVIAKLSNAGFDSDTNDARHQAQEITRLSDAANTQGMAIHGYDEQLKKAAAKGRVVDDLSNKWQQLRQAQKDGEGKITALENGHDQAEKRTDMLSRTIGELHRTVLAFASTPTITTVEKLNREVDEATGEPQASIIRLEKNINETDRNLAHHIDIDNTQTHTRAIGILQDEGRKQRDRLTSVETVLTDLDTKLPESRDPIITNTGRSITITY